MQIKQVVDNRVVAPLRKIHSASAFLKKRARVSLNYSNRPFVAQGHKLSLPALGGLGCHGHVVKC